MSQIPEKPTWVRDIIPIIVQKAKQQSHDPRSVAFADYSTLVKTKDSVQKTLLLPAEDERAAKIPFVLSQQEKDVFCKWLQMPEPLFMNIQDLDELKMALQIAVEVELATLPPYLTAMYSINSSVGGGAKEIYDDFHDIILQEMSHFGLACNMLLSVGGSPVVDTIDVVPQYPGVLPGGLRSDLTVHLRKFSDKQVLDFMSIEQPVKTRVPKQNAQGIWYVDETCDIVEQDNTIGYMYEQILQSMKYLVEAGEISFGFVEKQVENGGSVQVFKIASLDDAMKAINVIIEQGEGGLPSQAETGLDPVDDTTGEIAHYFRFAEMKYGRKIVRNSDPSTGFSYSGNALTISSSDVANMQDDPKLATIIPKGSAAYRAALALSQAYQTMLKALQTAFSGSPSSLSTAISDMFKVMSAAQACMKTPLMPGGACMVGPPFELPPADVVTDQTKC